MNENFAFNFEMKERGFIFLEKSHYSTIKAECPFKFDLVLDAKDFSVQKENNRWPTFWCEAEAEARNEWDVGRRQYLGECSSSDPFIPSSRISPSPVYSWNFCDHKKMKKEILR